MGSIPTLLQSKQMVNCLANFMKVQMGTDFMLISHGLRDHHGAAFWAVEHENASRWPLFLPCKHSNDEWKFLSQLVHRQRIGSCQVLHATASTIMHHDLMPIRSRFLSVLVIGIFATFSNIFGSSRIDGGKDEAIDLPTEGKLRTTVANNMGNLNSRQTITANETFAGCLLWKDDNHYLIEWLAYHYHTLPLRRLILAKDPTATTSPTNILSRYRGKINITEWTDVDYFSSSRIDIRMKEIQKAKAKRKRAHAWLELHRERQRTFMQRCMLQLMKEEQRWSWTLLLDVDEFLTINSLSRGLFKAAIPTPVREIVENDNAHPNSPIPSIVDVLNIARANKVSMYMEPCIAVPRLLYGSYDESIQKNVQNDSTIHFNYQDFATYRWSWRSRKKDGSNKAIVDLSRVNSSVLTTFEDTRSVHRPVTAHCSQQNAWRSPKTSLLVANHYVGTEQQWNFRDDPRSDFGMTRTQKKFDEQKNISTVRDPTPAGWLASFIRSVGINEAKRLLNGAGKVLHPSHYTEAWNPPLFLRWHTPMHMRRVSQQFTSLLLRK